MDGFVGDQFVRLGKAQFRDQFFILAPHPFDIGEEMQAGRPDSLGDGTGNRIGVDVVGATIPAHADRCNDGNDV